MDRRISRFCHFNFPVVRSCDQRRIDQRRQRDGRELHFVPVRTRHRQRCPESPSSRQRDRRRETHIVRLRTLRIQQYRVPVQVENIARCRWPPASRAIERSDRIQRNIECVHASGNVDVKLVHINVVTLPRQRVAGSLHVNSSQRADRPAGTVIPGNPFGKHEPHFTRVGRNLQVRVVDVAGSVD